MEKYEVRDDRFKISFHEFSFLVEACIPGPRPIARAMFWEEVIDKYYHVLSNEERAKLHEWILRNPCFKLENEDCLLFANRYNPENQLLVIAERDGKIEEYKCFRHKGRYHTSSTSSVVEVYIQDIKHI